MDSVIRKLLFDGLKNLIEIEICNNWDTMMSGGNNEANSELAGEAVIYHMVDFIEEIFENWE